MIVLGIDPGSTPANPTGWALVDTDEDTVIANGLFKPDSNIHIASLAHQFENLLLQITQQPQHVAIEAPWIGINRQTGLMLARLVGVFEGIAIVHWYPVRLVQPTQAKAALAHGSATKVEVRNAVRLRYGLAVPSHVADAIGVALASMEYGE